MYNEVHGGMHREMHSEMHSELHSGMHSEMRSEMHSEMHIYAPTFWNHFWSRSLACRGRYIQNSFHIYLQALIDAVWSSCSPRRSSARWKPLET